MPRRQARKLPDYFTTADDVTPAQHVDIQAASQIWIDSSISKTANVPTDYKYEDFKDIYLYAHEKGLKGCTTFRFNPEAFQGVLVKEEDLKNTKYVFTLEDGTRSRGGGRRGDRIRRRDALRRQPVRCPEGRLLRQVPDHRRRRSIEMGTLKIDKKIVKYRVRKPEEKAAGACQGRAATAKPSAKVIRMTEEIQRPEMLIGSTYKIKTPVSDHAMYVTINDIVLNEGTEHEQRRPFEVFINSKNLDHFQWIVALTRIISAVFRKGGDVTFLVEELKAVFDPRGGYWQPGGQVHALDHRRAGLCHREAPADDRPAAPAGLDEHQQKLVEEKRAEFEARKKQTDAFSKSHFPEGAQLCSKCSTAAVVMMDGCMTCLNCGDSKCG